VANLQALIVYGTRYGATTGTSEEIAKVLREEGIDVKVVNAKEEKVKEISSYDLVIVGSGMQMGRWTGEVEDFLKRFQNELGQKKVALFVSSMKTVSEREGKTADVEKSRKIDLDDKIVKFNLNPIAVGFFGGVLDFNKMNIITRKTFGFIRQQLEKDGFKQTEPGVYELRDWEEIRSWATELAQKASQ
jgi:menaquinone-dependent protoporphyrinogen oxidase